MKRGVKFIGGLQELRLVDRTLGPFSPGDEAELWKWDAEVLENHGIVVPIQKISPQEMRKLILLQERNPGPIQLPKDLYGVVRDQIKALERAGNHKAAEELRSGLMTLIEIRLPKLILLSLTPEIRVELPPEEVFLLNRLADNVEEWSRRLVEESEKIGEEVSKNGGGTVSRHPGDKANI